ncbi:hypothetical protein [Nitritalea halalkaliphila]|uniref:hypothetical protein n=1 Tax=Nitritalea halalkaliphila TaxID=590849 RepID=UPI0002F6AF03|nr:hypothetical protein [Nitritalea halalkaliphila]
MKKNPYDRRTFLALSGTVLAGTLLSPGIGWAKRHEKTIGLQLYSIRDNMQAHARRS